MTDELDVISELRSILLRLLDQMDRDLGGPRQEGRLSDLRREALALLDREPRP